MIIRLSLTIKVLARKFEMWISRFSRCLCFRFCFGFLHSNFHCRFAVYQMCRSCAAVFVSFSLHARPGTELSRGRSTVSFRGVMLATVIRRGLQSFFPSREILRVRFILISPNRYYAFFVHGSVLQARHRGGNADGCRIVTLRCFPFENDE